MAWVTSTNKSKFTLRTEDLVGLIGHMILTNLKAEHKPHAV